MTRPDQVAPLRGEAQLVAAETIRPAEIRVWVPEYNQPMSLMGRAMAYVRGAIHRRTMTALTFAIKANHRDWLLAEATGPLKYLALSALVSRSIPPELPLDAHALSVFSQNGEDGIIFELCRRVRIPKIFIEFGVGRGTQGNCVLLADVFGWRGLFIEAGQSEFDGLRIKYSKSSSVQVKCASVTPENINSVFRDADIPREIGILSIDIDGNDFWVWNALRDYSPAVVIVEYNSLLPTDEILVQPYDEGRWDETGFFGASLRAMQQLAYEKGYELVNTDPAGVNAFFVRRDLVGDLPRGEDVVRHGLNYYLKGSEFQHKPSNRTDWEKPESSS
jgi:hypothetical protein